MQFDVDGATSATSDRSETEFGIREVTSERNASGGRAFHVNGKNILIRGGGWSPDMMLREDSQRLHDEFRYVKDMGLNTVRLEGKLETQEFFDIADHEGILVMAGWCCCDFWEQWPHWQPQDFEIAQTIPVRSNLPPAQPSEHGPVAQRQRHPSSGECRADVPKYREGASVAESRRLLGHWQAHVGHRKQRRQNDITVSALTLPADEIK